MLLLMKMKNETKTKEDKMNKRKRAIGYVCDIPVADTDLIISRNDQRARMLKYAEKENLELVCVYEDESYTEDFMSRPGVQKILNSTEACEVVLVERVWAFSRKMKELDPLLAKLEAKQLELVSSSYLWDCVSQQVRHRYMGTVGEKAREAAQAQAGKKSGKETVAA
jgi:hypothetical protein